MDDLTSKVMDALFHQSGGTECANILVRHQVESFNEFIDKKLVQIIQGFNPIQVYHNYSADVEDFRYKMFLNVLRPSLTKPTYQMSDGAQMLMTPNMARVNNLTYACGLYVDIHIITEVINVDGVIERNENTVKNVCIGKLPIMVRSKACVLTQMPTMTDGAACQEKQECRYDYGGYFIINGNEKVVVSQDRISENKTLVFAPNYNGDGLNAEIRSMPDLVFLPPKTTSLHMAGKPNHMGHVIRLNASFLRTEIPLFVMFRALGIESDKEIYAHIVLDVDSKKNMRIIAELAACADDASDIDTQEDALNYIRNVLGTTGTPREYLDQPSRVMNIIKNTIKNDFLSHVGPSFKKKALYIGYMVRKLISIHLGYQDHDNRDSYLHKRIDTTGILYSNLFRQCYGKLIKDVRSLVVRELNLWRATPNIPLTLITSNNIHRFFKQSVIESGLRYALSTGNWGVKSIGSFQNIRQGVAQVLNRMSYLSMLSHLRRISTPMEKNGKLVQPRKLENTQYGMVCPAETPEGAPVGLVKNLAMSTQITNNTSSALVRDMLHELGVCMYDDTVADSLTYLKRMGDISSVIIIINGDLVGFHEDPNKFYNELKTLKRCGSIPPKTGIVWDISKNIISVSTEAGRLCRPLYTVEGGTIKVNSCDLGDFTFNDLVANGVVEFMDTDEIDKAMVSMFPSDLARGMKGTSLPPLYTHCEIHPSLMCGVLAANIPFMNHNQSPRNCYQCLWVEEPVYLVSGEVKRIKDIRVGDDVLTFNHRNGEMSNTRVIAHIIRPASKPMCRITTITGRSIVVSTDHKIMTDTGDGTDAVWKDSHTFMCITTRVGVYETSSRPCESGAEVTMKELLTAKLMGYYQARPSLAFDSHGDEEKFYNDSTYVGFSRGHRDIEFMMYMTDVAETEEYLNDKPISVVEAYVSGFLGGMPSAIDWDGGILDMLLKQITRGKYERGDINISFGYNRRRQMAYSIQAEYILFVKHAKATGQQVMTWEQFTQCVGIRNDLLMVPVAKIQRLEMLEIADITVESKNHSFIGGQGFAVSNSAMGKQAVGVYVSNFNNRTDTMSHILHYPQKPLTRTALSKFTNNERLPSGINAIVAIMTHTGFNQEDSVMMNKSAIDRGLFTTTYYKSYRDQCSKNHSTGEEEVFMKPETESPSTGKVTCKPFNYDKLGADGFVPKNTFVDSTDIIVGKVMPHKAQGVVQYRDTSLQMKGNDTGYIDMNYTGTNGDGYKFCKVRLRTPRKPTIGDKVASRHAQKGTIGMVYNDADMPFTKDGIRPDIIMNPHAVPSRMTIAQLMECIMGKAACGIGACGDCTPFTNCSVESIAQILETSGFEKYGNEILYNGRTGQQIQTEIFIGPTYYQRLKHMVADKMHSRSSNGPIVLLTRQPAEGRARNGGLRFGEMERDVLIGHGMGLFLKERMLDVSDNFRVFPCRKCGMISIANPEKNIYRCGTCKSLADTAQIRIPYAMSLLLRELESMSVALRLCI